MRRGSLVSPWIGLCVAVWHVAGDAPAQSSDSLAVPAAPGIEIKGAAGKGGAAYWVVARNAQGFWTAPSAPAVVENLPDTLGPNAAVEVTVSPVTGAVEYIVLKTETMQPVTGVSVRPAAPGERRFFYWVQWCNNWRESPLAGPVEARCADEKGTGNAIEWQPMTHATYYNVFRTDTPEPPLGRGFFAVGLHVAAHPQFAWLAPAGPTRVEDKGRLGQTVCGRPDVALTEPPLGSGLWVVGRTAGDRTVRDEGQVLKRFDVSNVNATDRAALSGPAENQGDIVAPLGAQYIIQANNAPAHLRTPSFGAGHLETLAVINNVESGGHSEYHGAPNGVVGWKSWIAAISSRVESRTTSQHGSMTAHLTSHGGGDAIPFDSTVQFAGCNNDGGDEGAYPSRNSTIRLLTAWEGRLASDCPRGSTLLPLERLDKGAGAAERVVVNLDRAYVAGRVVRVDNVLVHGLGTAWTPEMKHSWISFDVDNIGDKRCWYWITDVRAPDALTILAKTGWSSECNLGYSRFIYDPEKQAGPTPMSPNAAALRKLPEERHAAARSGAYRICPGVQLDDPWREGNALHVEPLLQAWKQGERVRVVAGPQGYLALARFMLFGEYLPQDQVGGISIRNGANRIANFPAIDIGGPGTHNFREGVHINLAKDGSGDGIVISAADHWDANGLEAGTSSVYRAAIVVPTEIPAVCGPHPWRYPHLRWILSEDGKADALQVAMRGNGPVAASFNRDGVATFERAVARKHLSCEGPAAFRDITLQGRVLGNDGTRGKVVFSGDGQRKVFEVALAGALQTAPVVTFSANQFARSRLADVKKDKFTVEFEEPPAAGQDNVSIWWLAQE